MNKLQTIALSSAMAVSLSLNAAYNDAGTDYSKLETSTKIEFGPFTDALNFQNFLLCVMKETGSYEMGYGHKYLVKGDRYRCGQDLDEVTTGRALEDQYIDTTTTGTTKVFIDGLGDLSIAAKAVIATGASNTHEYGAFTMDYKSEPWNADFGGGAVDIHEIGSIQATINGASNLFKMSIDNKWPRSEAPGYVADNFQLTMSKEKDSNGKTDGALHLKSTQDINGTSTTTEYAAVFDDTNTNSDLRGLVLASQKTGGTWSEDICIYKSAEDLTTLTMKSKLYEYDGANAGKEVVRNTMLKTAAADGSNDNVWIGSYKSYWYDGKYNTSAKVGYWLWQSPKPSAGSETTSVVHNGTTYTITWGTTSDGQKYISAVGELPLSTELVLTNQDAFNYKKYGASGVTTVAAGTSYAYKNGNLDGVNLQFKKETSGVFKGSIYQNESIPTDTIFTDSSGKKYISKAESIYKFMKQADSADDCNGLNSKLTAAKELSLLTTINTPTDSAGTTINKDYMIGDSSKKSSFGSEYKVEFGKLVNAD